VNAKTEINFIFKSLSCDLDFGSELNLKFLFSVMIDANY